MGPEEQKGEAPPKKGGEVPILPRAGEDKYQILHSTGAKSPITLRCGPSEALDGPETFVNTNVVLLTDTCQLAILEEKGKTPRIIEGIHTLEVLDLNLPVGSLLPRVEHDGALVVTEQGLYEFPNVTFFASFVSGEILAVLRKPPAE